MAVQTFNASTEKAEAGGLLQVPGQALLEVAWDVLGQAARGLE